MYEPADGLPRVPGYVPRRSAHSIICKDVHGRVYRGTYLHCLFPSPSAVQLQLQVSSYRAWECTLVLPDVFPVHSTTADCACHRPLFSSIANLITLQQLCYVMAFQDSTDMMRLGTSPSRHPWLGPTDITHNSLVSSWSPGQCQAGERLAHWLTTRAVGLIWPPRYVISLSFKATC